MTEAYIYDHVRSPRGRGKPNGSLHAVTPINLASQVLGELRPHTSGRPLVVAGGSLGCVSALYLAARHDVDGVLVQNPPALREVIQAQSGWWHFKWLSRMIADQIPCELDSIANAQKATVPAVFVTAQQDRIVPAQIQRLIIEAYKGPLKVFSMPDAGHDTSLTKNDQERLRSLAGWLYEKAALG